MASDDPFDLSNMGAMLQQFGAMLQRAQAVPEGQVDWDAVKTAARTAIAQQPDPSVVDAEHERVRAAAELAQLWLDAATDFPAPSMKSTAWSRAEWLEHTFPAWRDYLEPIALAMGRGVVEAVQAQELPASAAAMLGPMLGMVRRIGGLMAAQQVGHALGSIASDAWSSSDAGLPLQHDGLVALVTGNTRDFADGLGLELRDVETYIALREAAAQRLFHAAPWIAARLRDAVREYADGVHLDADRLRDLVGDLDTNDPQAIAAAVQSGDLELPLTQGQTAAIARVEHLVSLIEGWIDVVVESAHGGRIGNAGAIQEALRRRRATGAPSQRLLQQLLGVELQPRTLRAAAAFWAAQARESRDDIWQHPDFLPDDLSDR